MKKGNNRRRLRRFKLTVLTGLLLFVLSSAVSISGGFIFHLMNSTGLVTDKNRFVLWLINIIILFILAGWLINFLLSQIFGQKTGKLIEAMKKVSAGELDVKLSDSRKLTDPGHHTVTTFNDMTAHLQTNAEFSKDFAGNFSHEIRTPIGTINGFAKVLKNSSLTEEEKIEYLNIIIDESERLNILSNNILLMSRLENRTEAVTKSDFNLTEQLRQTVAVLYFKWSEKNIDIVIEGDDVYVSANRELTAQMWINLIDNAIKFSPANEKIYINILKNADCITVSIKNYGSTLSGEDIPHIFDKYYQGSGEKKALGAGLGLSMVKKITELHGGTVSAELCGDGAIQLTVSLPLSH